MWQNFFKIEIHKLIFVRMQCIEYFEVGFTQFACKSIKRVACLGVLRSFFLIEDIF